MLNLREEHIDEEKHFRKLGDFICGADDPLNTFLSDNAISYDNAKLGRTYLVLEEDEIIAFYTLKTNGLQIKDDNNELEVIPMIEISRIAVANDLQSAGLGKKVFYELILDKVKTICALVAVKGIMAFVEKENEKGIAFYKSVGFERAESVVNDAVHSDSFNEGCDLYVVSLDKLMQKEPS